MTLYIDGDALPNPLKKVLVRAIERFALPTYVIANKPVYIGNTKYIKNMVVDEGPDEADHRIVEMIEEGDLVITADIPLADRVIDRNAVALNHHGKLFTANNIKSHLAMRNLLVQLRDNGEIMKGMPPFSKRDIHQFANQLDQILTKARSSQKKN
ncbi:MAG: YaiI/YqxD family protein [Spirochaetes bacterium]|nr:YaiI/YqxD family protein [Spirochaetota bacterium]